MWDMLEKQYDTLDLKGNILTQGESIRRTLRFEARKVEEAAMKLKECSNIILTGAGDKYIIPHISRMVWRSLSKKPIEVYHSRVLLENNIQMGEDAAVIFLSQSGLTHDTIYAYKKIRSQVKLTIWVTNLKENLANSIYGLKNDSCLILNTHTVHYPEKPIISTSTFQTSLSLLNDLLLTTLSSKEASELKATQIEKLPPLVDALACSKKVTEWAKKTAEDLIPQRQQTFYVMGDGIRYFIAVKQALIMFMEGCKQDASPIRTEEFLHSLIETLEPENPVKKPLLMLKPHRSFASERLLKMTNFVSTSWKRYAGKAKIITISPYDLIEIDLEGAAADLLSPSLYIVPLMWLTYYYALRQGIDPGVSKLVNKVRKKII